MINYLLKNYQESLSGVWLQNLERFLEIFPVAVPCFRQKKNTFWR